MSRKRRPVSRDPRRAGLDPGQLAARRSLADHLRARASDRVTPAGHAYGSPQEFVLKHGVWQHPARWVRLVERHCFANALYCALVYPGWSYVEGYALGPAGIPVHHAWCLDELGRMVELTWRVGGAAYVGVRFAVERADDCTWEGDATVLDDHQRGWPVLRGRWAGEPGDVPRSDRLRALAVTLPMSGMFEQAGLPAPPRVGLDEAAFRAVRAWMESDQTVDPDEAMRLLVEAAGLP